MPSQSPTAPLVILTDDDIALRTALSFSLELDGFRVETCANAEELLARRLPQSDACIVVDLNMPGLSGLEAVRKLRTRGVMLPAILITSQPTPPVREAAGAIALRIIEKPLLGDYLVTAIREALQPA